MSALSKARSVLDLDGASANYATFSSRDEDTRKILRTATISAQDYAEMGRPEQVTVTIEPGDRLNDVDETREAVEELAATEVTRPDIAREVELVGRRDGTGRPPGLYVNGEPAPWVIADGAYVEVDPVTGAHIVRVGILTGKVTLPERDLSRKTREGRR